MLFISLCPSLTADFPRFNHSCGHRASEAWLYPWAVKQKEQQLEVTEMLHFAVEIANRQATTKNLSRLPKHLTQISSLIHIYTNISLEDYAAGVEFRVEVCVGLPEWRPQPTKELSQLFWDKNLKIFENSLFKKVFQYPDDSVNLMWFTYITKCPRVCSPWTRYSAPSSKVWMGHSPTGCNSAPPGGCHAMSILQRLPFVCW